MRRGTGERKDWREEREGNSLSPVLPFSPPFNATTQAMMMMVILMMVMIVIVIVMMVVIIKVMMMMMMMMIIIIIIIVSLPPLNSLIYRISLQGIYWSNRQWSYGELSWLQLGNCCK